MPKVSVVIPCYNLGAYLEEAIASVWAQTFSDYEIIVVDDGSEDPLTLAKLDEFKAHGLQIIKTNNQGVAAARNRGINETQGEYILPLDADDMIAPTYLEQAVAILDENPDTAVVYCDQKKFGELEADLFLPDYDTRRILVQNLLPVAAVLRRECWEQVGGYCEKMKSGWEDWEFWVAVSRLQRPVIKIAEPLFFYRITAASRDRSLRFSAKLAMYGLIAWRHRLLYLSNLGYILSALWRHIKSRYLC